MLILYSTCGALRSALRRLASVVPLRLEFVLAMEPSRRVEACARRRRQRHSGEREARKRREYVSGKEGHGVRRELVIRTVRRGAQPDLHRLLGLQLGVMGDLGRVWVGWRRRCVGLSGLSVPPHWGPDLLGLNVVVALDVQPKRTLEVKVRVSVRGSARLSVTIRVRVGVGVM